MPAHDVVDMIAVRHRYVFAVRTMVVVRPVRTASV